MVDTTDEWIMTRVGIKERRILKDKDKGSAWLGARAVENLLEKTNTKPEEVDLLICATVTPDMHFPANAQVIADMVGIKNAFGFDLNAGCSGFIFGLVTATQYVESGRYKKVVFVGAEKMSVITDYTDRKTCPLFGDASAMFKNILSVLVNKMLPVCYSFYTWRIQRTSGFHKQMITPDSVRT